MTYKLREESSTYNKDQISDLTHKYIKTRDESTLNDLLQAVQGMIEIQLGKYYQSMRVDWQDMKQDCILRLWESLKNNPEQMLKSQKPDQYFWQRIRVNLHQQMHRMKDTEGGRGLDKYNQNMRSFGNIYGITKDETPKWSGDDEYESTALDRALYKSENVFDKDTIPLREEQRMNDKFEVAVTMDDIVNHIAKTEPESAVGRLKNTIGTELTGQVLENLSGQRLWIPKLSSLWRVVATIEIMRLKKLDRNGEEFKKRKREIREVYGLTNKQFVDILESGRYTST